MVKAQTWLMDISQGECAEHLASSTLGRLGVVVNGRPEIFPVNHVYDAERGHVTFATNDRTKLSAATDWPWVAYEVDGSEPGVDGEEGWSVLVVGRVEKIKDPTRIKSLESHRRALWHPGTDAQWVEILPEKISGRRIAAVVKDVGLAKG